MTYIALHNENSSMPLLKENEINYQVLNDSFYKGMRNALTEKRLEINAELARTIKEPKIFGKFDSDVEYLKTVDFFISSTLETRHRGIFFVREVLPRLHRKNDLLDIGPGNGALTKWICRGFKNITLIDTSVTALNQTLSKLPKRNVQLNKLHTSIYDVELTHQHYDLVIMSHILYHIAEKQWMTVIKKVYNAIKKNGVLVIVLNGGCDRLSLVYHFGGKLFRIEDLANDCANALNAKIEVFSSQEFFYTKNISSMANIAGLHLHDAGITANKDDLIAYLANNHSKSNGYISTNMTQTFLIISKSK